LRNYRFKDTGVRFINDTSFQRNINRISFSLAVALVLLGSYAEEILTESLKAASHDAVSSMKNFVDTVTVVAVDIDVENVGIGAEEFENAKDNVVDVAEIGCLAFFWHAEGHRPS
jgi:hypothetical protein